MLYSRSCYTVLNAFGIKAEDLLFASELEFIKKWSEQYAFSSDIIAERRADARLPLHTSRALNMPILF